MCCHVFCIVYVRGHAPYRELWAIRDNRKILNFVFYLAEDICWGTHHHQSPVSPHPPSHIQSDKLATTMRHDSYLLADTTIHNIATDWGHCRYYLNILKVGDTDEPLVRVPVAPSCGQNARFRPQVAFWCRIPRMFLRGHKVQLQHFCLKLTCLWRGPVWELLLHSCTLSSSNMSLKFLAKSGSYFHGAVRRKPGARALHSASKSSIRRFVITEKAPTRAFS